MIEAKGMEVFSRMLIATVEYCNDEHSPVFGLMYLLLSNNSQQVSTFEENVRRRNNMGVMEGIGNAEVSNKFFRGNLQS
jgi:hypothetical protein